LKKAIRPKRRLIKFVASIKANFNQNIFPQSKLLNHVIKDSKMRDDIALQICIAKC